MPRTPIQARLYGGRSTDAQTSQVSVPRALERKAKSLIGLTNSVEFGMHDTYLRFLDALGFFPQSRLGRSTQAGWGEGGRLLALLAKA